MDLLRDYGLTVADLVPHAGGFATEGWVADRRWFVKRWKDGSEPLGLTQLGELHALGLPVVEPLRTIDGELYARSGSRAYAVFPYVEGRTATWDDWPTVARLDDVRARLKPVRDVVCHTDFHGLNVLIGADGAVAAILDWESAVIGPREYDLWVAADGEPLVEFLDAYGADDLDANHLEFALLARGLRDLAARVMNDVDRPGVDTWGFDRIARVDSNLAIFRRYCA
ncbi:phosphotransferase enzyme family protein [Kribbella sp. NPDC059898]|uniref:phosphotransferase enzyme family protein n=1 Tax=Kribbella sp. NPDC059898 TaxID=3346995 RepID=UPI0036614F96